MPRVSIIIPVYNTAEFLPKCLDSVSKQTLSDIEIICINDGSQDNCPEILREYSSKDNRIKVIDFKENRGVSIARNTGINEAHGEYLGFVDSDDFISPEFYERLYYKAILADADAVKGKIKIYSDTSDPDNEAFYDIDDDIKLNVAYFCHSFTSAIYKTTFIKTNKIFFPENINNFEDPYFSILAGFYYKRVELLSNAYYYYRKRKDSLSGIINQKQISDVLSAIEEIYDCLNKVNVSKDHYLIVYSFLIKTLQPYIFNKDLSASINLQAVNLFTRMLQSCKYREESVGFYIYKLKKDENKLYQKKIYRELVENIKGNRK